MLKFLRRAIKLCGYSRTWAMETQAIRKTAADAGEHSLCDLFGKMDTFHDLDMAGPPS